MLSTDGLALPYAAPFWRRCQDFGLGPSAITRPPSSQIIRSTSSSSGRRCVRQNDRPVPQSALQIVDDPRFQCVIHRCGRLIERYHARIAEQQARQGDRLPFAAGQSLSSGRQASGVSALMPGGELLYPERRTARSKASGISGRARM
jgi:hypothetical protein